MKEYIAAALSAPRTSVYVKEDFFNSDVTIPASDKNIVRNLSIGETTIFKFGHDAKCARITRVK